MTDVIGLLEQLAQLGTAPEHGCTLFSVGFDEPIQRIRRTVIEKQFDSGNSTVKFVIGPYGSGKTHFLRHLQDVAEAEDCVTAEIALNLDIDYTKSIIVFREVARQIRPPGATKRGMEELLRDMYNRVTGASDDPSDAGDLLHLWFSELDRVDVGLPEYPRVLKRALLALRANDSTDFELSARWLAGSMSDRSLAKQMDLAVVPEAELNLFANRAMIALFQIIRHAEYRGTVIAFDEADQGFTVDGKKMQRILSMLQSTINAYSSAPRLSALLVFALTPDVIDTMETYPALQQRIADPGPGLRFFNGYTRAVRIDLRDRNEDSDLLLIGQRLVEMFYAEVGSRLETPRADAEARVQEVARAVVREDVSSANRRTLVKRAATLLLQLWDAAEYSDLGTSTPTAEDEV